MRHLKVLIQAFFCCSAGFTYIMIIVFLAGYRVDYTRFIHRMQFVFSFTAKHVLDGSRGLVNSVYLVHYVIKTY